MEKLPKSYHTFLFPFIWKTNKEIEWDDFKKILSVGKRWKETSWKSESIPHGCTKVEWIQHYSAFQYFTESANNAIFNTHDDNVVRCFEFCQYSDKGGKYIIYNGSKRYELIINHIRLHVYDAGVAILIFELENHDYNSVDDINIINERGRRANMPYIAPPHSICASKIELSFEDKLFSCENFEETVSKYCGDTKNLYKHISLNYIMRPIQKLLDNDGKDNGGYEVSSHYEHTKNDIRKYYIKPCVDDRMFVCCLVRDEKLSHCMKKFNPEKQEYHYLSDCFKRDENDEEISGNNLSAEIYKLCYIEESTTCNSAKMRHDILRKSVYDRWIDWGTIHAITHHSIVCITGEYEGIYDAVISPFLTEYVQMAILSVAQRSTILMLSDEAATLANGFSTYEEITIEQINEIEKLQAKYVKIESQLLLPEVTVQEQGVEIYDMMREHMYLIHDWENLNEKMRNLRDMANISHDRIERKAEALENENSKKLSNNITALSVAISVLSFLQPLFSVVNINKQYATMFSVFIISVILIWRPWEKNIKAWFKKGKK